MKEFLGRWNYLWRQTMQLYYTVLIVTWLWVTWNYELPCSLFFMCVNWFRTHSWGAVCFTLLPEPLELLVMTGNRGGTENQGEWRQCVTNFQCPIITLLSWLGVTALSKAICSRVISLQQTESKKAHGVWLLCLSFNVMRGTFWAPKGTGVTRYCC